MILTDRFRLFLFSGGFAMISIMRCRAEWKSILMILIGGAGMILFLLPVFLQGIVVSGNLLGVLLSAALLLWGLFPRWFRAVGQRLQKHRAARALRAFLAVCLAIGVGLAAGLPFVMIPALSVTPDDDATLVILGCDVIGDQPGVMLQERLDAAYAWLQEHPSAAIVVTGGRASARDLSEADAMAEWLLRKGVDADRIYRDDTALSTSDNIRNAERIIQANGLSPALAVATSDYHIFRSLRIAAHFGYQAGAVPGHTVWWLLPTYYAREILGIVHEVLFRHDL